MPPGPCKVPAGCGESIRQRARRRPRGRSGPRPRRHVGAPRRDDLGCGRNRIALPASCRAGPDGPNREAPWSGSRGRAPSRSRPPEQLAQPDTWTGTFASSTTRPPDDIEQLVLRDEPVAPFDQRDEHIESAGPDGQRLRSLRTRRWAAGLERPEAVRLRQAILSWPRGPVMALRRGPPPASPAFVQLSGGTAAALRRCASGIIEGRTHHKETFHAKHPCRPLDAGRCQHGPGCRLHLDQTTIKPGSMLTEAQVFKGFGCEGRTLRRR